uniref:pyridoxal 5'-phosphate synthase (glutamine hydrolyzing) n=1 Tax=Araucaria cunninghamii TaxID=56994 RepID=A0A0D6R158_ARACU
MSGNQSGVVALLDNGDSKKSSSYAVKVGLAQMLRGGVIVEVREVEQARIAEEAGAIAVVAAEPMGPGVNRMCDPGLVRELKKSVGIPVISRARIGHFVEAQVLEAVGADFIDESEELTPADDANFINKHNFRRPFVCGCSDLGGALRRVAEGAAMMRTEGNRSGDVCDAVRNVRAVLGDVRRLQIIDEDELYAFAKEMAAPFELVKLTKQLGRLPVLVFAAGGIATPADAAMMMQIGCDGVFVDSSVFDCPNPAARVRAFVQAVVNYNDSQILAKVSSAMEDLEINETDLVQS